MFRVFVLIGLLSLVWTYCSAESYFVSPLGSPDSLDCSEDSSCVTIEQAITVFGTSSSSFDVYLAAGVYSGNQNIGLTLPTSTSIQQWTDYPGEIVLNGADIDSNTPCFQSTGNLTLNGITIQECYKAIYSNAGPILLSGVTITTFTPPSVAVTALNVTFADRIELNNCIIQSGAIYGNASEVIISNNYFASNNSFWLIGNTQTLTNNTFNGLRGVTLYANESITLSSAEFYFNEYMSTSAFYAVTLSDAPIQLLAQYTQKVDINNVNITCNATNTLTGAIGIYAENMTADTVNVAGSFYKGVLFQGDSAIASRFHIVLPSGSGLSFQGANNVLLDSFTLNCSSTNIYYGPISTSNNYAVFQNGVVYDGQINIGTSSILSQTILRNLTMLDRATLHLAEGITEIYNMVAGPSANSASIIYIFVDESVANVTVTDSVFSNLNFTGAVIYLSVLPTGIYNCTASVLVKNCTFSDNTAITGWLGGNSQMIVGANMTIMDCTFVRNSVMASGIARSMIEFVKGGSGNIIKNSYFEDSVASNTLISSVDDLVVSNCTFVNHIQQQAPLIKGFGITLITDSLIQNTGSFPLEGEGLVQLVNNSQVINTVFNNNKGSLLWMYGGQINGCTFTNNSCISTGQNGAALSIWSNITSTSVSNCIFSNNNGNTGAGIYVGEGYGLVTIETSDFYNNNASAGGSAIYVSDANGGAVNISSSTFENNLGSTIYLASPANVTDLTFTNYSTYAISCADNVDVYYSAIGTINVNGVTDNSQGIDDACTLIEGSITNQVPSASSSYTPTMTTTPSRSSTNSRQPSNSPTITVTMTNATPTADTGPSIWLVVTIGVVALVCLVVTVGAIGAGAFIYKKNAARKKGDDDALFLLGEDEE